MIDNKHQGWQTGNFLGNPEEYSESELQKHKIRERLSVRPSPEGNAICICRDHNTAWWIAERLNRAAALESKISKERRNYNRQKWLPLFPSKNLEMRAVIAERILGDYLVDWIRTEEILDHIGDPENLTKYLERAHEVILKSRFLPIALSYVDRVIEDDSLEYADDIIRQFSGDEQFPACSTVPPEKMWECVDMLKRSPMDRFADSIWRCYG